MSLCRKDVYIIGTVENGKGVYQCMSCIGPQGGVGPIFRTARATAKHLRWHRKHGWLVEDRVFENLEQDDWVGTEQEADDE